MSSVRNAMATMAVAAALSGPMAQANAAVIISSAATANIACVSGVCTPSKKNAILNVTQLENLLTSGNVKVTTAGSKSSDIVVSASLGWASANSLTLDAYQLITIDEPVAVNGTGGLTLTTNNGGAGGALSFGVKGHVAFLSTANSLTIDGAAYTLVNDVKSLANNIAANAAGNYALASSYNASADGTYSSPPVSTVFTGRMEGLGNIISHLNITAPEHGNAGLFLALIGGVIENLGLTNVHINGDADAAGALLASNVGTLFRDYATGNVYSDKGLQIGGLAGSSTNDETGHIGLVDTCYFQGSVILNDADGVGHGLGGLVGFNTGSATILNSYATGSLQANPAGLHKVAVGGLVGRMAGGTISNSYAAGSIAAGSGSLVGGLVGYLYTNPGLQESITDSYATSAIAGGSGSSLGGLIGYVASTSVVSFGSSYWDTTTTGITNLSQGVGNIANEPGITGLTTPQLQAGLPTGFAPTIWGQNSSINGGLPYLLALPPK